ncbi:hypothetical protein HA520_18430 [Azotobacter chroococcum]|uniref:5-hmdU DNA kinase helical domain-containing protein n=1 Tax=Azotobacter chroococcum TaxID=353 RepID=A0AA44CA09_9GAMM|nr:nucleotide kinase domain-containing protein [Azotobacter chroococcum]NHN79233.1 hypothetical protein [Azotobacter chroococcum]
MKIHSLTINEKSYPEYWIFAYNRQLEFLERGKSQDSILNKYKFTNCYRFTDRVSQHLIKNIINREGLSPQDTFVQVILFKIFNKIETWESICCEFGNTNFEKLDLSRLQLFLDNLKQNNKIYSAAYIMPSGLKEFGSRVKHHNNLAMIKLMITKELHKKVWEKQNLREIYELFLSIPSIGKFLAYQYSIDIAYSKYSPAEEHQYVIAGPGAERGIKKCFMDTGKYNLQDVIKIMRDHQHDEFSRLGLDFTFLGGRELQLIDCQNIFCEVDKYLRVKIPELNKRNTKIKQIYKPNNLKINYEAPQKWNLNFLV